MAGIFEHGRLNKSLGASDYCRPEPIVGVVEFLLPKVLSSLTIKD